jgi:hypothetical protein
MAAPEPNATRPHYMEQPRTYYRVTWLGCTCVCETRAEVDDLLDDEENTAAAGGVTVEEISMLPSEYEKLPEFQGI